MKKFSYHGFVRIGLGLCQLVGMVTIVASIIGAIYLWYGAITVLPKPPSINPLNDARFTLLCVGIWMLIVCSIVGTSLINFSPTVWLSDKGIEISIFIFFKKTIQWSEVVDIGYGRPPMKYVLVRARRITFFHRFLGWLYSYTFYPSFLIGPRIENREILLSEIRHRIMHSSL